MQFSDSKNDFQIGNIILRLETRFLDQKQNSEIESTIFFRLKYNFFIGKKIFRLKTHFLHWNQDF